MNRPCTNCAKVTANKYQGFVIAKVWANKTLVHQVVLSDRQSRETVLRRAIGWCEEQSCNWICEELTEGVAHLYEYIGDPKNRMARQVTY